MRRRAVERAVFELNIREHSRSLKQRVRIPDDEYVLRCVVDGLADLAKAANTLLGRKGVRR